ncbi:MoaD/ThiS family protein [Nannocystis pusilla]|uniref:MoaD/ThiS family protein n=1 Tax=Nannocystis pusilla TaxID=889268 RepID=A0ABS7TUX9_9BACT|nr:MoaD/ThiS family protein [Nannocystis pusilla]MBZ5711994.1 MoaD/ThiS family protein [Nannocystis pusilla]
MVTVELYGVPRLRAGASSVEVPAGKLASILHALASALPGLSPDIIRDGRLSEHALVAIDGREVVADPERVIADGATLVLISAAAGG